MHTLLKFNLALFMVDCQAASIPKNPHRPRAYHILRSAFHITLLEVTILAGNLKLILKCWPFSFSEALVVLISWSVLPSRVGFVERTRRSMYFLQSRQLALANSISIMLRIWGKRHILFIIVTWGHFPWEKVRQQLIRWLIMTITSFVLHAFMCSEEGRLHVYTCNEVGDSTLYQH